MNNKKRIHQIWNSMKSRINNSIYYANIEICDEWYDFNRFYDWAIKNGYNKNLQIDRINNNKNYEPENCRWVTAKENCRNRRNNVNITYNNETHTIVEWAEKLGVKYICLWKRIKHLHWSVEKAFTTPIRERGVV